MKIILAPGPLVLEHALYFLNPVSPMDQLLWVFFGSLAVILGRLSSLMQTKKDPKLPSPSMTSLSILDTEDINEWIP